jgi:hypothetical protein
MLSPNRVDWYEGERTPALDDLFFEVVFPPRNTFRRRVETKCSRFNRTDEQMLDNCDGVT